MTHCSFQNKKLNGDISGGYPLDKIWSQVCPKHAKAWPKRFCIKSLNDRNHLDDFWNEILLKNLHIHRVWCKTLITYYIIKVHTTCFRADFCICVNFKFLVFTWLQRTTNKYQRPSWWHVDDIMSPWLLLVIQFSSVQCVVTCSHQSRWLHNHATDINRFQCYNISGMLL